MTQQEAATAAGTTVRYLADLERGSRNPSLRMLTELAQLLDVRVADLVEVGERREPVDLSQVTEASAPKPGRKPSKDSRRLRPSR